MLVLINGLSGNVGSVVAESLLARGHQVRGLGRDSSKVDAALKYRLESFVTASSWYDTAAHDRACSGVDAVVNASAAVPVLMLDHQLLLLRAAERAGIKIFVPSTWNYDWTKISLGSHESYDHLIMFKRQAELSSDIKPIYIFTGSISEFWFRTGRNMNNVPELPAWDMAKGTGLYFGDGKTKFQFTTFRDLGEYTAELVLSRDAALGGCFDVMSFSADMWEMREAYRKVTGKAMELSRAGSVDDLRAMTLAGRENGQPTKYKEYLGLFYLLYTVEERWMLDENNLWRHPDIKPQSLEEHLTEHIDKFARYPDKAN